MKPLVCVRHQSTAPLGVIGDVIGEGAIEWRYLDCWDDPPCPEVSQMSGLIVLGGEMNADDITTYPYLDPLRVFVREAVDAGLPVLGICLGAQILTRSLGADVYPSPVREIGFRDVHATDDALSDPVLAPFAPRSKVFQFHEDACALPEGADLLFTGDEVAVQAFRYGSSAYGVQFHFEVTRTEIETWCDETPELETTWGTTKKAVLRQADEMLEHQQGIGREVAKRFTALLR
ncbi:MAG: type 1 glutamine amidotransferase [Actinomycetota bacterium]